MFQLDRATNEKYRQKKSRDSQNGRIRNSYEDDDRDKVSAESPDSYDLSLSMETKILSSNSSSKDREKLVPSFRQSVTRSTSNQYQNETQLSNGVCLMN